MVRPTSPNPTDWELVLLKILWNRGQSTVDDVREALRDQGMKRSDSAVRKMLQILADKGLAHVETIGRGSHFTAAIPQKHVEKNMFQHLIESLFGGSREQFLLRALDETNVTPEVVKKMKEILQEQESRDNTP